ncbi:Alpha-(1,6)-fucosyltransferase [Thelohanellus kitauei]|uniref:Alpha-(1,6)-fucosyltransferase n=1 Tax=Thelohanellus kitauei TaxID=669202 RepID=A0A0C2MNK6_THEKT|nr:Alpha-(1,6)-fucosyltransferase [Thelohanellus kitauei]
MYIRKDSSSALMNKSDVSSFDYPNFLKEWNKLYTSQNENLLFIAQYAAPGMLRPEKLPKNLDFYNHLIRSNLFQKKNLIDLRSNGQKTFLHESLVKYVHQVIHRNQNPENCRDMEVIGYETKEYCGFGCQIHLLAYCLIVALGEGKPLVVKSDQWQVKPAIIT